MVLAGIEPDFRNRLQKDLGFNWALSQCRGSAENKPWNLDSAVLNLIKIAALISKATLLELELTGTVETIGGQIYCLKVEVEIPSN